MDAHSQVKLDIVVTGGGNNEYLRLKVHVPTQICAGFSDSEFNGNSGVVTAKGWDRWVVFGRSCLLILSNCFDKSLHLAVI